VPRGRPKGSKNKSTLTNKSEAPKKRGRKPKIISDVEILDTNIVEEETEINLTAINPFEITLESFQCDLQPIFEWAHLLEAKEDNRQKLGTYSSCRLPIKNTKKVYPVVAYITTDLDKHRSSGYTDKQIYLGCINYLTKNQSKNKLKRLGELYPYSFKIVNDKISTMFLTTEQKSKMFWGEGTK
jgi:hypothetical protein